jgi:hypothetical protein
MDIEIIPALFAGSAIREGFSKIFVILGKLSSEQNKWAKV